RSFAQTTGAGGAGSRRDEMGRVIEEKRADGSARAAHFDAEGNAVQEARTGRADRNGKPGLVARVEREYTSWNLLAAERSASGSVTRFEYTHRGRRRAVVDGNGNRTEYV